VTIRLGLQIPNFSYGTGVVELFPTVIAQAREGEAAGFDSIFMMGHFYQLPMLGTPDQPMLEAYTALGGLATATERVQLGTLVTGNTYRNPTLLAKAITTLDVISGGRAILGIGTGWSSSNTTSSASSSAPSPTGSTSSTRRCRSSCR
jgi:alkanesulfonate monooxygenase SsuD/methylene tetrahydromethanopterin reductase-like flavin-dependent oxidoreductase (luciferase family)